MLKLTWYCEAEDVAGLEREGGAAEPDNRLSIITLVKMARVSSFCFFECFLLHLNENKLVYR